MQFPVTDSMRRKARTPHELFMVNLAAFHLMLGPAAIFLGIGGWGLLLPPFFSGLVILYFFLRSRRAEIADPWFVMAHWKLAWRRCRLLIIGYAASAVIIGGGGLLALTAKQHSMQEIIFTVATRVGVMPTIIIVLVSFVLANSSLEQVNKGEVPDSIVKRYPAPETSA